MTENVIQLRNGERIRPEEFPADHLAPLNGALDAIRDEPDYRINLAIEKFLQRPAVVTSLTIIGAFLIGWAAGHPGVQ